MPLTCAPNTDTDARENNAIRLIKLFLACIAAAPFTIPASREFDGCPRALLVAREALCARCVWRLEDFIIRGDLGTSGLSVPWGRSSLQDSVVGGLPINPDRRARTADRQQTRRRWLWHREGSRSSDRRQKVGVQDERRIHERYLDHCLGLAVHRRPRRILTSAGCADRETAMARKRRRRSCKQPMTYERFLPSPASGNSETLLRTK